MIVMQIKTFAAFIVLALSIPAFSQEFDGNGCRVLSKLPAPGVHPRVFFTADEYPLIRERLNAPHFKKIFGRLHEQIIRGVRSRWEEFSKIESDKFTDAQILKYFKNDEGRNIQWGVTSLLAILNEDVELRDYMIRLVVNHGKLLLFTKERYQRGEFKGSHGKALKNNLKIWSGNHFDVGVSWTIGAAGYALSFDVLHPFMTEDQRAVVTRAIGVATKGRKSYGNGMDRGFASSNHYGYHGDLVALLSVIEDTPHFDQKTWDGMTTVLKDYWEVGFTALGACREDGYGANLGLRAGSRGLLALARRGYNIFNTEKYRNFLKYITMEYDPFPDGHLNGGASGGPYPELYPTSTIIAQYMYPKSSIAQFNYRHLLGAEYHRRVRWQGWLDFTLYGTDWEGPESYQEMVEACELPLEIFYPVRGKIVARSDWSDEALYVTLDARPDAHLIGHDKVDRGNFSMSALGRIWAFSGDFHAWNLSRENSLVHIDGKAQPWKAPSVRFLWHSIDKKLVGGGVDLKYAYDWEWSPPWPKWGKKFKAPWEPERNGPLDLGWPKKLAHPDVCPSSIHGSETGYNGRNNLHRRPYNPVQKAFRSLYMIRGEQPYVLILDDIRKDDGKHLYEWVMQVPMDLKLDSHAGGQVILKEESGDRRLLIQFLNNPRVRVKIESYEAHKHNKTGKVTMGKRLVAAVNSVEPEFRVMLLPMKKGQEVPRASLSSNGDQLEVRFKERVDQLKLIKSATSATKVVVPLRGAASD